MNNSESTMRENERPSQQALWLRAIISAAVFGSMGAVVGRWLGKRGNDRETRFAESVMTWSMGTFCGLLASYSTFKAAEQSKDEPTATHHAHAIPPRIAEESPARMAKLGELTHEGKIHAHGPQSVIEK
jgi:hypothetical protein